jgi:hypothetical protein
MPLPGACHAVFTSDPAGYSPEIFSRLSGDVWLGGLNSQTVPLPALPTLAEQDPQAIRDLLSTAEALLGPILPSSLPAFATMLPPSSSARKAARKHKAEKNGAHHHHPHSHNHNHNHRHALTLLRSALCFRPVAPTGRPVIARMHEADLGDGVKVPGGVFVATGHGPWGISLGLGTGWVVSEMVLGREPSVDVRVLGRWEADAP